jgi:hypothetical protein
MHRMHCWACLAFLAGEALFAGCGSSDSTVNATAAVEAAAGQPARDNRAPGQVMASFLELKQQGNHYEADKLLSDKAREVIGKTQMPMLQTPTGTDVKCEIGDAQMMGNSGARVLTTWTVPGARLDIRWIMRNDPEGWRIVGAFGALDPTTAEEGAIDFESEDEVRAFQRKLEEAYHASSRDGHGPGAPPPETAAKPAAAGAPTSKQ